jgi:selenide,water dikinase
VYKLTDDIALIQTVDFFTPIVDDPYTFGLVTAANALSDVYAMGGIPLTAMNVICFPIKTMEISVLHEILRGGLDKMREANVLLVGGHSVDDDELKYGLSLSGTVHPEKVILNRGARPGDSLIITKPLGTGIINTALKANMANDELVDKATKSMTELNKKASELMVQSTTIHACTDVTGFGLLGHAAEMIEGSDAGMIIDSPSVPILGDIKEFVDMGIMPGGLYRNRAFRLPMVEKQATCPDWIFDVMFDPQTSGGLLISLPHQEAVELCKKMNEEGITNAAIVGKVTDEPKGKIIVT